MVPGNARPPRCDTIQVTRRLTTVLPDLCFIFEPVVDHMECLHHSRILHRRICLSAVSSRWNVLLAVLPDHLVQRRNRLRRSVLTRHEGQRPSTRILFLTTKVRKRTAVSLSTSSSILFFFHVAGPTPITGCCSCSSRPLVLNLSQSFHHAIVIGGVRGDHRGRARRGWRLCWTFCRGAVGVQPAHWGARRSAPAPEPR